MSDDPFHDQFWRLNHPDKPPVFYHWSLTHPEEYEMPSYEPTGPEPTDAILDAVIALEAERDSYKTKAEELETSFEQWIDSMDAKLEEKDALIAKLRANLNEDIRALAGYENTIRSLSRELDLTIEENERLHEEVSELKDDVRRRRAWAAGPQDGDIAAGFLGGFKNDPPKKPDASPWDFAKPREHSEYAPFVEFGETLAKSEAYQRFVEQIDKGIDQMLRMGISLKDMPDHFRFSERFNVAPQWAGNVNDVGRVPNSEKPDLTDDPIRYLGKRTYHLTGTFGEPDQSEDEED